ncbi:MAG: Co2+/Mg2+ efflux protein ApaG [Cycloclasticus sp. symbiont of Poecilosclerida sp. M]|nr:MAG: Co2+/Mg2+ efflux protein ApaG [Cycloclasticus sp. symbiont of Poecilosclerida sp. M]
MSEKKIQDISVDVETTYIPSSSDPDAARYVFAYSITIKNRGTKSAQLLSRHWVITDSNGKVQEVHGEGVVGEQPSLKPGESYQYTSGAVIETSIGAMQGSYEMIDESGKKFDAVINPFSLSPPRTLH